MKERLLHTPEGVRDIYNSECAKKMTLETKLHNTMHLYGFEDIQTPTFEFFDIFSEERGTVASKNMYKFFDREGNTLVLRPDMTPSIARCAAKYYSEETNPIRLCYIGNTFINNNEYQGKLKETTQIGAELINDDSAIADCEMLALMIECLLASGLTEFQVEVGQVSFFKALVEEAGFEAEETAMLKNLIENKNIFGMESFMADKCISEELKLVLTKLPELFGGMDRLAEVKSLTSNKKALDAINRLELIYELMKNYGYEKYIGFDLGMLSKYEYYTGIIFDAFTYGTGDAVISGGRYDSLVAQFGKQAPAIGMAITIDRLMVALARQKLDVIPASSRVLVLTRRDKAAEALAKVKELRRSGRNTSIIICSGEPCDVELAAYKEEYSTVIYEDRLLYGNEGL